MQYADAVSASPDVGGDASQHIPRTDVPSDFKDMWALAKVIAKAERGIPSDLMGNPANVVIVMMRAKAMDIPFMTACDHLLVGADNTVFPTAQLALALARRDGHRFNFIETTPDRATVLVQPRGERRSYPVTYSRADAVNAGLTSPEYDKDGFWDRYPEDWLVALVARRATKRYASASLLSLGGAPRREHDGMGATSDAVSPPEEDQRQLVEDVVGVAIDLDRVEEPSVRVQALRHLWEEYRELLDYAADPGGSVTLRQLLYDRIVACQPMQDVDGTGEVPVEVRADVVTDGVVAARPAAADTTPRPRKKGKKGKRRRGGKGAAAGAPSSPSDPPTRVGGRPGGRVGGSAKNTDAAEDGVWGDALVTRCGLTMDDALAAGHTCTDACEGS